MIKLQTRENSLKNTAKADYIFAVSTEDSLTVADICRRSVENNGKVDYDTMMAAVSQYFKQERKDLLEGKMANTPNYHAQACAHGTTTNAEGPWGNDPGHFLEPRFTYTPDLKKLLNEQHVQLIEERQLGPRIGEVYDFFTKTHVNQPDPHGVTRSLITPTRNLAIKGKGLRILPLDPPDMSVGVFFIKKGATPTEMRVPNYDITHNDPSTIEIVTPTLQPGEYYIEVRTKSNTQGNAEVKELRTVRYKHTVTVEQE